MVPRDARLLPPGVRCMTARERSSVGRRIAGGLMLVCALASPAAAQDLALQPSRIEAAAGLWIPHIEVTGSAEGNKIRGTTIDYRRDLGLADRPLAQVGATWRFTPRNKIRLQFLPIEYTTDARPLAFDVLFRGVRYPAGTPVTSAVTWNALRVGYEYDFILRERFFAGVIVDVDRTNITLRLTSAAADEAAPSSVPTLPAFGGVARFAIADWLTVSGELTGIKVPDRKDEEYGGHFANLEAGGLVRLAHHLGVHVGVRSINIRHLGESDTGTMRMTGAVVNLVIGY
jgi:hypothetical protein